MPLKLLLGLLLLAGCPPGATGPDGENPDGEDPAVDIGTGEIEFVPLEDGDRLAIVEGAQGGYHLFGALRCKGLVAGDPDDLGDPDNPTMSFGIDHGSESIVALNQITQGLDEAPESEAPWTHWMLDREARMSIPLGDDVTLDGETVEFSIRITDVEGTVAEDTVSLVLFPSPTNG